LSLSEAVPENEARGLEVSWAGL